LRLRLGEKPQPVIADGEAEAEPAETGKHGAA
jgi:hypothetical protein